MNDNFQSIRGYRVIGDPPKPDRELSFNYLQLKDEAAKALTILRAKVKKDGANCIGREDEFSGKELPTDRDAQLMCAGCPAFQECEIYRQLAHPAWGVHAGKVHGRGTMETVEDNLDEGGNG